MLYYYVLYIGRFHIYNYDDSVGVDLHNIHSTYSDLSNVEYSDDDDVNYVVYSGHQIR